MYGLYSRAASNQERPMMARVRYVWLTHEGWAEIWWIRLSLILVGSRILLAIADQNSELGLGILPISGQTFGSSNPPQHYFHWESFWLYDLSCLLYQSSMFLEYLDLGTLRQSNWNWKKWNKCVNFVRYQLWSFVQCDTYKINNHRFGPQKWT